MKRRHSNVKMIGHPFWVFFLSLLSFAATAQEGADIILSGVVISVAADDYEATGVLGHAEIILLDKNNNEIFREKADELGHYAVRLKPLQFYTIVATADGFQSQRMFIETLSSNALVTEHVDFKLHPATTPEHHSSNRYLARFVGDEENYIVSNKASDERSEGLRKDYHVKPEENLLATEEIRAEADIPVEESATVMEEAKSTLIDKGPVVGLDPLTFSSVRDINAELKLAAANEKVQVEEASKELVVESYVDVTPATPVEEVAKAKVVFKVQLGKFSHAIGNSYFSKLDKVEVKKMGDFFVYSLGQCLTLEEAQSMSAKVRALGFSDAFVKAFVDDRQVSIMEAITAAQ